METNREDNNVGYLIGRYSYYLPTAAFLLAAFDRKSDDDEYQIYALKLKIYSALLLFMYRMNKMAICFHLVFNKAI